jgi:hypothetical protein
MRLARGQVRALLDVTLFPTPISDFRFPISEFQPLRCRPCGDGSGEKLQALLS